MSDAELLRIYAEGYTGEDPHVSGLRAIYDYAKKKTKEARRG